MKKNIMINIWLHIITLILFSLWFIAIIYNWNLILSYYFGISVSFCALIMSSISLKNSQSKSEDNAYKYSIFANILIIFSSLYLLWSHDITLILLISISFVLYIPNIVFLLLVKRNQNR